MRIEVSLGFLSNKFQIYSMLGERKKGIKWRDLPQKYLSQKYLSQKYLSQKYLSQKLCFTVLLIYLILSFNIIKMFIIFKSCLRLPILLQMTISIPGATSLNSPQQDTRKTTIFQHCLEGHTQVSAI